MTTWPWPWTLENWMQARFPCHRLGFKSRRATEDTKSDCTLRFPGQRRASERNLGEDFNSYRSPELLPPPLPLPRSVSSSCSINITNSVIWESRCIHHTSPSNVGRIRLRDFPSHLQPSRGGSNAISISMLQRRRFCSLPLTSLLRDCCICWKENDA